MLVTVTIGGCAHYAPAQPVGEIVASSTPMSLDVARVRAEVCRSSPGRCGATVTWGRDTFLAAAQLYNADIRAAEAHVDAMDARRGVVRQWPAPGVSLLAEYARHAQESSPWLYGGTADIAMDVGTRRATRLAAVDRDALVARYALWEARWGTRSAVRRGLGEFVVASRELALRRAMDEERGIELDVVERRAAQGEVAGMEALRLRADIATGAQARLQAESRRDRALRSLANAVGVDVSALSGISPEWPDFDVVEPRLPAAPERSVALERRGDVLQSIVQYEQADDDVRVEIARQYPSVSLAPGYTWERGLVKLPLGVNLGLPTPDLNRHAIEAAVRAREAAATSLEAACARVFAQQSDARAALEDARSRLVEWRTSGVPNAEGVALVAQRRFAAGAIDRASLAAANVALLDARLSELGAVADARRAESDYEDALRRSIDGADDGLALPADLLIRGR